MSLSTLGTSLIDHLGLLGVGIGVGLNGLGVPGVSEVVLPLAGVAIKTGHQPLIGVLIVAYIGQVIGSSIAYGIAKYAGEPVIKRYGKYVLVTEHELARAQTAFDKYGAPLVIVGAFVPGIQGFMGYVAGLAELSYGRFLVYISIGKIIWIGGLVGLGYAVSDHIDVIDKYVGQIGIVVLVAIVIAVIWYIKRHARDEKSATSAATNHEEL